MDSLSKIRSEIALTEERLNRLIASKGDMNACRGMFERKKPQLLRERIAVLREKEHLLVAGESSKTPSLAMIRHDIANAEAAIEYMKRVPLNETRSGGRGASASDMTDRLALLREQERELTRKLSGGLISKLSAIFNGGNAPAPSVESKPEIQPNLPLSPPTQKAPVIRPQVAPGNSFGVGAVIRPKPGITPNKSTVIKRVTVTDNSNLKSMAESANLDCNLVGIDKKNEVHHIDHESSSKDLGQNTIYINSGGTKEASTGIEIIVSAAMFGLRFIRLVVVTFIFKLLICLFLALFVSMHDFNSEVIFRMFDAYMAGRHSAFIMTSSFLLAIYFAPLSSNKKSRKLLQT